MRIPEPPERFTRFLEWFCPPELSEGILGDLYEAFEFDFNESGLRKARMRYRWNVIRFFRPAILLRNKQRFTLFNNIMWSNYLKVAVRNLYRRKLYSFINAIGLSIAIAFCGLIYLYIQDEKSFDTFHENGERIYRMEEYSYDQWSADEGVVPFRSSAYLQTGLVPVLKDEISQVERGTRYSPDGSAIFRIGDKIFNEEVVYVDKDFFHMFSFDLLSGSRDDLFAGPRELVITPEIEQKYFDGETGMGKTIELTINGNTDIFTVTGIIEAPPANSSLNYHILIPQENRPYYSNNIDRWNNFNTPGFVMLRPNADLAQFDESLALITDKYMGKNLELWRKESDLPEDLELFRYKYTSLPEIHMDTDVEWERVSDPQYAYILGGIALFILVIACINYISLALTTSAARRIEVGIRKAVGAQRNQLLGQFSFESMLLAILSMFIGLALLSLFLPYFNDFTSKKIIMDGVVTLKLFGFGLMLALLVGFLSGGYPALFLSSIQPTQVLKGRFTGTVNAGFTRPLVVLQFTLSAVLIISSVIMYQQMKFITTKDLGYSAEQVVVIPTQEDFSPASDRMVEKFRQAMLQEGDIISVAGTTISFNHGWSRNGYEVNGEDKAAFIYGVDPYYIPMLDIELVAGRNFDPSIPSDSNALVVNESLVRDMGWEDPLNEHLNWMGDTTGMGYRIIGVVKDYHFMSLESGIYPMFMAINTNHVGHYQSILAKIRPGRIDEAMDMMRARWKEIAPDKPFDYSFMDEDVAAQYARYQRWMKIMGLATGFAILISCLGLFGLAGINAVNKTKEIGIRKVMGAGVEHIFLMLNKQFIWLALIAFIIAAPVAYYFMSAWLGEFEYAIEITWHIFALSMLGGLVIALLTVSYHAVRAANINPSETLKYE